MKKPFFVILALILGIIATNYLIPASDRTADSDMIEDSVQSSQAAPKQVNGDIPL